MAEISQLCWFSFNIVTVEMRKDKIEDSDAPQDVVEFMVPAVAKVFPPDLTVELAGEQVISLPVHRKGFGPAVLLG